MGNAKTVRKETKAKAQGFYDRIADIHNLSMKVNRYRSSVAKYLESLDLKIGPESLILDAGSGTGIITLAFHDTGFKPKRIVALDLSFKSLEIARDQFSKQKRRLKSTELVQGNVLRMPFSDATFDLVLTCGVLEYIPLDEGLGQLSRVLKPGGRLVLVPVKPSIVGTVLELLYNFKLHPLDKVKQTASRYFRILDDYEFPITEPIGWSKRIFLLEKK